MEDRYDLTERLRDRILVALHVGRVRGGDRLPGVREVARETGANARTVARAYRELEREGLVEIRGRSGVYVVRQDHWGGKLLAETGRWLGGILAEAWKRNIPIPDLADLIRRCTKEAHLRAVCLAGNEDNQRGICEELTRSFGIESIPLHLDAFGDGTPSRQTLPAELHEADFIVSTAFSAGPARSVAESIGKPVVLAALHPEIVRAIEQRLAAGQLTVVCADAAFGEQIRSTLARGREDRVRVVLATDRERVRTLTPGEPVLLTRAAQETIGDVDRLTPLVPFIPFISPDSAREISELMVRLHMEREHGAG